MPKRSLPTRKLIDQLTRAAELNPGSSAASIETYFALGKLFRRKGDLERALRLHQNIMQHINIVK